MDNNTAIKVLTSLAHGINPATGEFLPNESVLNGLDATRALFFAVECMRDGMQRLILWDTKQTAVPMEQGKEQGQGVAQIQGKEQEQGVAQIQGKLLDKDMVQLDLNRSVRSGLDGIWQYRPVTGIGKEKGDGANDGVIHPAKEPAQAQNVKRIEMQPLDSEQQLLYETLKTWRNHLAMSQGYAPYMVLSNDSLARVACEKPETIEALAKIKGFGEIKMQKYAIPVLALVRGKSVSEVLGEKTENRPLQLITPTSGADGLPQPVGVGEGEQQFLPVYA